jgi:hypothetical protein
VETVAEATHCRYLALWVAPKKKPQLRGFDLAILHSSRGLPWQALHTEPVRSAGATCRKRFYGIPWDPAIASNLHVTQLKLVILRRNTNYFR